MQNPDGGWQMRYVNSFHGSKNLCYPGENSDTHDHPDAVKAEACMVALARIDPQFRPKKYGDPVPYVAPPEPEPEPVVEPEPEPVVEPEPEPVEVSESELDLTVADLASASDTPAEALEDDVAVEAEVADDQDDHDDEDDQDEQDDEEISRAF